MPRVPLTPHQELALTSILRASLDYHQARALRVVTIREGRRAGLSWVQIGERLGMTDKAAKGLVDRADKAASL